MEKIDHTPNALLPNLIMNLNALDGKLFKSINLRKILDLILKRIVILQQIYMIFFYFSIMQENLILLKA